jgi:hypothetical protein
VAVDERLIEAARSVRPFLEEFEFSDSVAAADVDGELARLLKRAARGEDVEAPLRALLERHEATSEYLASVLDDPDYARQRSLSVTTKGYSPLAGAGDVARWRGRIPLPVR